MSANKTFSRCTPFAQYRDQDIGRRRILKRKLAPATQSVSAGALPAPWAYPSPPMSGPPSPQQALSSGAPAPTSIVTARSDVPSEGPIATFAPALATSLPSTEPPLQAPLFIQPGSIIPGAEPTGATTAGVTTASQQAPVPYSTVSSGVSVSGGTGPSARGGRRAKTHVASACVNCKRAHLSCDVQRPCARCVASGKQDTCVDVQHKKRGRPRVREEGQFGAEQVNPPQSSVQAPVAGPSQPPARPTAATRHRRAESFRSIQSGTTEDSPRYVTSTPRYTTQAPLQSPVSSQLPPPLSQVPATFEVATALLNTDFAVVRANRPFESIIFGGAGVRGRHISDLASPADNEAFLNIRNSLRAEREARDPAYMPPIMQPGQDPVQGIPEADAEQYAQGFNDRTYIWRRKSYGSATETFPVRVRLAKAATYFVVVTLPSFQPVGQPILQSPGPMYSGPLVTGPPLHGADTYDPSRSSASRSAPPAAQQYIPNVTAPMQGFLGGSQLSSSHTYPPPQPPMPFQHPAQQQPFLQPFTQAAPRMSVANPTAETAAFTPRSRPVEGAYGVGSSARQLPPLGVGPPAIPAGSQGTEAASSDDGEEEGSIRSPRKRRRMGIDDVLHR